MTQPRSIIAVFVALALAVVGGTGAVGRVRTGVRVNSSCEAAVASRPGEVLVRFRSDTGGALREKIAKNAGAVATLKEIGPAGSKDTRLIKLGPDVGIDEAIRSLVSSREVLSAEPNLLRQAMYTPSDPGFPYQWGLENTGQNIGGVEGVPGADIDATNAWDIEDGQTNQVTVAVLDSGINFAHPDLASKIWVNPGELPGNDTDDDDNGYTDDVMGYNFAGISQKTFFYVSGGFPVFMSRDFGNSATSQRFAQSITGTGHDLTHAGILLGKEGDPTGDITVSVRTDLYGPDISSFTVAAAEVGSSASETYLPLSSSVPLESGATYYLVFDTDNQNAANYYKLYENRGSENGNVYSEGQGYTWDGGTWNDLAQDDFYFKTNPNPYPRDDNGHGTYVSGIVGAESNDQGITGVSPWAKIMPLKVLDGSGVPSGALAIDLIVEAIYYAADNGARVISMSLGGPFESAEEQAAIDYAHGQGVVLVAAVGNYGDETTIYPAGCDNVMGAGATNNLDEKASFSSHNATVDVTAPGWYVYSTTKSGGYGFGSGTSAATPTVAGLAALILSFNPSLSASQVQQVIEDNALDLGDPGRDDYFGHGRIDACGALSDLASPPHIESITPCTAPIGAQVTISGSDFGFSKGTSKVTFNEAVATACESWSDTETVCTVPAGTTDGPVSVTTANGTSNGVEFTVSYPAPTVTSIAPNSGTNDGTVNVTNLAGTGFRNGATVKLIGPSGAGETGAGTINATNVNVASSTKITCTFDLTGAAAGSYEVKVENTDGRSGTLAGAFTVREAPAPPGTTPTWYLAEGSSDWGFDTYISIENPNDEALSATVTYMTEAGAVPGGDINLPARSQTTVNPRDTVRDEDFSTRVECKEGKTIAVDRTMSWTGEGAPSPDGHCSIGVTSPATTWYLPEGSSAWGFECWLLTQNPNDQEATAQVTYMIEGADPQTFEKKVPANARETYNMANDIGEADASIEVVSDIPVIPERAMYRNNRREGHDSIGTTAPALSYYLAEGTTAWGFTTYVLVQNPQDTPTDVTLTYMTNSGPVPRAPFTMPGNSRKTIRVNDALPASDFSTQVSGSQPIIAERAMYWGEGTEAGEACHDSIGLSAPHTTFYLPDGQTSDGRETYTLV
ncbi:MAG: S8 family serine peptidase, partial [Actinomycetia bacterium]|nr:S8 family serine peptidase [Actinomycetes bacterium]